ncbi:MAG: DUF4124 domain-containing protein, partial [Comamonadaceae bacterium]
MMLKLLLLLPMVFAAASASAQIYKCPDASGRLLLQQTPCSGGRQASIRPASGEAPTAAAVNPAAPATAGAALASPSVPSAPKSFNET